VLYSLVCTVLLTALHYSILYSAVIQQYAIYRAFSLFLFSFTSVTLILSHSSYLSLSLSAPHLVACVHFAFLRREISQVVECREHYLSCYCHPHSSYSYSYSAIQFNSIQFNSIQMSGSRSRYSIMRQSGLQQR
jgi:hypothetical protein